MQKDGILLSGKIKAAITRETTKPVNWTACTAAVACFTIIPMMTPSEADAGR
jgi:hypothetical protein